MNENLIDVGWKDYQVLVEELISQIKSKLKNIEYVVAVLNGGFNPASAIAKNLNESGYKTNFLELKVSHYNEQNTKNSYLTMNVSVSALEEIEHINKGSKHVLIVDDILDSGDTLLLVKNLFAGVKKVSTATLFTKRPDDIYWQEHIYAQKVPISQWIKFPWEKG